MNASNELRVYFDCSPVGVVATDASGVIKYANRQFTKLTGYSAVELVGEHVSLFGRPTEVQRTEMWAAVRAGQGWQGDVQGEDKDGNPFFARLAVGPLAEGESMIAGLLCLAARRPPTSAEKAAAGAAAVAQSSILSEPEREMLRHLSDGLADGEIAERLGVSVRTVDDYISAVLWKLNVPNRISAVVLAEKLRVAQSLQRMGE